MTIRAYDNQQPEIDESAWVDPSAVVAGKSFWVVTYLCGLTPSFEAMSIPSLLGHRPMFRMAPYCTVLTMDLTHRVENRCRLENE